MDQPLLQPDDAIQQFCSVTACTPEQARFFLESSNWQLETALQNFFEADSAPLQSLPDEEEEEEEDPQQHHASVLPPSLAPPQVFQPSPDAWPVGGTPNRSARKPAKDKKAASSSGSIKTLSDLNRRSDSDSDDDNAQEYYTGGEKSGMLVQDPQKGNRDVDAIFEQARRMGAQEGPSEPLRAPSSSRSPFAGVGRTLTGEPTQQGAAAGAGAGQHAQPDPIVRSITFWRNGFTVDDGPLRRLDDPANAQFLMSISKSECPKELEPADRGTPVHVNLMRKNEDWMPPAEPRHVAFQGVGRTLGSSSTEDAGNTPPVQGASNQPFQGLTVDNSQPVTSIQLRLSDGTRMVARFNHHHTVADIRGFIDAARPGHLRTYQLQTMGFPPKLLTNLAETIEAAGLINAVVIQKA